MISRGTGWCFSLSSKALLFVVMNNLKKSQVLKYSTNMFHASSSAGLLLFYNCGRKKEKEEKKKEHEKVILSPKPYNPSSCKGVVPDAF